MIKKILIANRGEIAIRVMRTSREMGIKTVAIYSDADADALHVQAADEKVCIGDPEPSKSYLRIDKVLDAARETGADAIHPGYGFLSERADFSEACAEAGITFIGPSGSAMRALGAKIEAKQLAVAEGVPVTPGFFEPGATDEQLIAAAKEIGMPVMLKASAGGGGRGMRIVREVSELASQLKLASDEALSGFGDGAMMVERYVERPRHIEVQLIADQHGNVAPLFERECSIQRRHQKLLEEAPSPLFGHDHALWAPMRDSAIKIAKAAGYVGAGTMEFMVEPDGSAFFFLELNARLQVEHPVTECITSLDLVKLQIQVANGENLQDLIPEFLGGERAQIHGHSVEARVVAEDPARGFLPSIGKIIVWSEPKIPGVRIDTGFGAGSEVTRFYDSLLAKVIAHGPDRPSALRKLVEALREMHVLGVRTNIEYLIEVLEHPGFQSGEIDTGFLGRYFSEWHPSTELPNELAAILAVGAPTSAPQVRNAPSSGLDAPTAWDLTDGWRIFRPAVS